MCVIVPVVAPLFPMVSPGCREKLYLVPNSTIETPDPIQSLSIPTSKIGDNGGYDVKKCSIAWRCI